MLNNALSVRIRLMNFQIELVLLLESGHVFGHFVLL